MFKAREKYRNSPAYKYINSPQLEEDLKEAAKKMTNKEAIRLLHRDTTREAVAELEYYAGFNKEKTIEQIQEAMDMGAGALKQTTWVPCSEKLPENIKTVLVTLKGMEQPTIGWYGNIDGWRLSEKEFCGIEHEVIAWMPLPEPYKEAIRNN